MLNKCFAIKHNPYNFIVLIRDLVITYLCDTLLCHYAHTIYDTLMVHDFGDS